MNDKFEELFVGILSRKLCESITPGTVEEIIAAE